MWCYFWHEDFDMKTSVHRPQGIVKTANGKPLPLVGQNLPNPTLNITNPQKRVPAVAQLVFRGSFAQLLPQSAKNLANLVHFLCTLPGTTSAKTIPTLAHIWCPKPYAVWHFHWPKWYPRHPSIRILPSKGIPPGS